MLAAKKGTHCKAIAADLNVISVEIEGIKEAVGIIQKTLEKLPHLKK